MILHPGVIALFSGSSIVLIMVLYAALMGGVILKHWDFSSSSAYQLSLERKTYLISTLINYALAFQVLSTFLFLYTVDDIHRLFVGSMCATGSLNANPVGWYGLLSKILVFFLAGVWIALNVVDQKVEDYPLVRLKYFLLIFLLPFIVLDFYLQLTYFLGLDPDIITSCCGSLFGEGGKEAVSSLNAMPVAKAIAAFYSVTGLFISITWLCLIYDVGVMRYLHSVAALLFFIMSIIAIISFVSIYIYELPTHHCPFDILQHHYTYIGYPLYFSLFGSVFFGILAGLFQPLKRIAGLQETLAGFERKWLVLSMGFTLLFVVLVTWLVAGSNLSYFSY